MLTTKKRVVSLSLTALFVAGAILSLALCLEYDIEPNWAIGIYVGTTPYEFSPHPSTGNAPVLTANDVADVEARFVADPFLLFHDDVWYMFFEVLNRSTDQGDIGLASSREGTDWKYHRIVLDEDFHLSYPYVFAHEGEFFMVPESREVESIRLYKATDFPGEWAFQSELLIGDFADPSLLFHEGLWWLFVLQGYDTLTLHYAEELTGPWTQHPESPLIEDDRSTSRPGGRLIVHDGGIIRYAQQGVPTYGRKVRAFRIVELSKERYREHEIAQSPVLVPGESGWNADGMHHIDPSRVSEQSWLACVDGRNDELDVNVSGRLARRRIRKAIGSLGLFGLGQGKKP